MKVHYPLNNEIIGKLINPCNRIEAVHIPIGVTVYVSTDEILDTRRDHLLTDMLERKQNLNYAEPIEWYLHTIGTSAEDLVLDIVTIGKDGIYIQNTPREEMKLKGEVEQAITAQNIKSFDPVLLGKLQEAYAFTGKVYGTGNTPTTTTLYEETLTCDKIEVTHICPLYINNDGMLLSGASIVYLDDELIDIHGGWIVSSTGATSYSNPSRITEENVKGKVLKIRSRARDTGYVGHYYIKKYDKKA